jgi:hypothetical protein
VSSQLTWELTVLFADFATRWSSNRHLSPWSSPCIPVSSSIWTRDAIITASACVMRFSELCNIEFLCSHWSHATWQIFWISALVHRSPEFCFPISRKYWAWIYCHSTDIFPNMNVSHPMSSCASCSSWRSCSIVLSTSLGVFVFHYSSLDSRNRVSPGCVCLLTRSFPSVSSEIFHFSIADGDVHIVMCAAVSQWCPHLGHFWVDLYPHNFMNFPVPVIPCLCFMT